MPNKRGYANRVCNLMRSRGTAQDWTYHDALQSNSVTVASIPAAVDLRKGWWTIGDQGQTGSCVGWAVADGVVRYHMVLAQRLLTTERLSPRYVWMASKETDAWIDRPESFVEEAGTQLKAAMDVCRKYGVVPNTLLPFNLATGMYRGSENAFYATAAKRKISAYFNLGKDLSQWKAWLAGHGPILAGLDIDVTWDNATATGGKLDVFLPGTVRGGHAVTVVGYTNDGWFRVRNSWGTAWGAAGFALASPAYIAAAFFDESYGVTV